MNAIKAPVGIAKQNKNTRAIRTSGAATIVQRQLGTPAITSREKNRYAVEGTWVPAISPMTNTRARTAEACGSSGVTKGTRVAPRRRY